MTNQKLFNEKTQGVCGWGNIKANKVMPTCGKACKKRFSLCYVHAYLCVCTFSQRYSLMFESCFLYTVNMQNVIVTVFAIFF